MGDQPYHVTDIPGATFTWTLSGGGTITGGDGTHSITVNWDTPGGPYTLSVFATLNGCPGPVQSVEVTVVEAPVGPTLLAMTPPGPAVCEGTDVSATFNPGTGGIGCNDEFEYSYDGSGTWVPYNPGDLIATTGHTLVEIRGRRAGCETNLGCNDTPWVVLASWTITSSVPVSVTITADPNPVCEGSSVTFTAVPVNGGSTPVYTWYLNGVVVTGETGDSYTYVPNNNDEVYCELMSSETCGSPNPATSNTVTVTVNPLPAVSPIWHN